MDGSVNGGDMAHDTEPRDPTVLWTAQNVADFLQVSLRWVEKRTASGELPTVRLPGGRLVRYDQGTVRAWARDFAARSAGSR
jgi:excisionase family DNA binding protein